MPPPRLDVDALGRSLLGHAHLTLDELRARQPEVATGVETLLARDERTRIDEALADLPAATRQRVRALVAGDVVGSAERVYAELVSRGVDRQSALSVADRLRRNALATGSRAGESVGASIEVTRLLERSRVRDVATLAGMSGAVVDKVGEALGGIDATSDAALEQLVSAQTITEDQARQLGRATAFYELVDRDATVAKALDTFVFPALGHPAADTRDLSSLSIADWTRFIDETHTAIPEGTTKADLAASLADRFAALHPQVAFAAQLPKVATSAIVARLTELQPLFARTPQVVGARLEDLDTSGFSPADVQALAASHAELQRLARAYPGLGLTDVLDRTGLDAGDKADQVARRIDLLQQVYRHVGDADDAFRLDYSEGSPDIPRLGLDSIGATADEQRLVVDALKSFQRAFAVAGTVAGAQALVAGGFASGIAVGRTTYDQFRSRVALDPAGARKVWEQGRSTLADVTLSAASVLDLLHGLFDDIRVGNVQPGVVSYLKKLAGFQDLFGALSFCDCEACQSILGPAAYFVDLMTFVDEYIRPQLAAAVDHPLDLKTRRPDLWTLPLTCANTNERIPALEIVNEILENDAARRLGFTGSLGDRDAIGTLVYAQTLAVRVDSVRQPFHLPLARLSAYLSALGDSRPAIAAALGAPPAARARATLGISLREYELITQPDTDLTHLSHVYGLDFAVSGTAIEPVNAAALGTSLGRSRQELGALLAAAFVTAAAPSVVITAEKRTLDSIQNDIERVHGFTPAALDRLHRLHRVARALDWPPADVDPLLTALGDPLLTASTLDRLAALARVRQRRAIAADELAALVGTIPLVPAARSLFDRLFNSRSLVASGGAYPQDTYHVILPAFRGATAAPADPALSRLTSALGLDVDGLTTLVRALAPHLAQETHAGFDAQAPSEDDRYFVLSVPNLTLLYRHTRLARLLGVTAADLLDLMAVLGVDRLATDADLHAVVELQEWLRGTPLSLDDLLVASGRLPRQPARYPDAVTVSAAVVASASSGLTFRDTVFAAAIGTSEQGSRDITAANPALVEEAGQGGLRLREGADLGTAAVVIPPAATVPTASGTRPVTDGEVRAVLRSFAPADVLARALGAQLRLVPDTVRAMAELAQQPLSRVEIVRAVRGGPIQPLEDLVRALVPLSVAFRGAVWDAENIAFIRARPAVFSADPVPALVPAAGHPLAPFFTLDQLRAIDEFARVVVRKVEPGEDPSARAPKVRALLSAFDTAAHAFPATSDEALARVLGVGVGLIVGLREHLALPSTAVFALAAVARAADLARDLGVDGEALTALVGDDYAALQRGADALLAALYARYPDEDARATAVRNAEAPVLVHKRDALVDHLMRSLSPVVFKTRDDLYEYFLADVSVDGCFTTSRVVAATGSVQQYVQRVLLNLEQDELTPTDPAHIALRLPADAAAEWSWRKNYRVWEANRKVFLWPENYIEPDLRDDKTPLFRELEEELLQTDITDQNVLDAYSKYLKGFEEVASLSVAGAWHDVSPRGPDSGDVLHLFGVSSDDPPTFYYRTCDQLIASGRDPNVGALWSPWRKVNLQITGRTVSPVIHAGRLHVFWTDIKTRSVNRVEDGASQFVGYQHKMSMRFTTLRLDGTWAVPQPVTLPVSFFWPGPGEIVDLLRNDIPQYDTRPHVQAIDDYTLSGINWEGVWLEPRAGVLYVTYRDFWQPGVLDLFRRSADDAQAPPYPSPRPQLLCAKWNGPSAKTLFYGTPVLWWGNRTAGANLAIDEARLDVATHEQAFVKPWVQPGLYTEAIAQLPGDAYLLALPGSVEDAIVQVRQDVLLLQGSVTDDQGYLLRRIGTTLASAVSRRLFSDGVQGLLDIATQLSLAEAPLPIGLVGSRIHSEANVAQLDLTGPYGVYYREIFFHIPFLIANALNARGRFATAQQWYHYLFDPTATEVIAIPQGTPPEEVPHRLLDRVWRYREFRGLNLERMRDVLTDETALALYRKDPFNPHAIARRRLSAYQKSIVMKYVDNLLDWADFLFTQFTMESVTEASMLYVVAADVLGPRPARLGSCGEGAVEPKTYEQIGPLVDLSSEILVELETWTLGRRWQRRRMPVAPPPRFIIDPVRLRHAVTARPLALARTAAVDAVGGVLVSAGGADTGVGPHTGIGGLHGGIVSGLDAVLEDPTRTQTAGGSGTFRGPDWNTTRIEAWAPTRASSRIDAGRALDTTRAPADPRTFPVGPAIFCWTVLRQLSPVFCVPANRKLLEYWDRVEDRQFKIRHCMDITGAKRELALFAPELDADLLARLKAAGLTLEDVLGASGGDLPPYRFLFLVDRAKAFASALSGFGASLLATIEKKDTEELGRLRLVQTQNISRMTTQVRRWDLDAAEAALESLRRQRAAAEYRRDYYDGLASEGRNRWEEAQSVARHLASAIYATQSAIDTHAAIGTLLPQTGSPFAMKYGGVEIGGSLARFGNAINAMGLGLEATAASTELEAAFGRRTEGWELQKALAERDMGVLDQDLRGAEIRRDIAERALELHQTGLDQLDEVLELTDGKFSSLGLYTFLSSALQRMYREAYQNALRLARLAERAFFFERGEGAGTGLGENYWDPEHAGLLAGERLLLDLESLERRFLETNYRSLEIDQPFALSQIDPRALLQLRDTGECEFEIQELFFDLSYPGHYKRQLKNARLTIPSITGPFVNVSATLTLVQSRLRPTPALDGTLVDVPPQRSVSIATSTAQNDAGVFELSFRDERYMPFEGAGAISRWQLRLPRTFRQFDYQTINDVVLSISYTAEQDGLLRERVEEQNAALEGTLAKFVATHDLLKVLSFRQDFSAAFTRLLRSPTGTPVPLDITARHFPLFARQRTIQVQRCMLLLRTAEGVPAGFELVVDGASLTGFTPQPDFSGLPGIELPLAFANAFIGRHAFSVAAAGPLAPASVVPGDAVTIDPDLLLDVFVSVEYRLA